MKSVNLCSPQGSAWPGAGCGAAGAAGRGNSADPFPGDGPQRRRRDHAPGMARQRSLVPQPRLERRRPAVGRRGPRRGAAQQPLGRPRLEGSLDCEDDWTDGAVPRRSTTTATAACRAPSGTPTASSSRASIATATTSSAAAEFTGRRRRRRPRRPVRRSRRQQRRPPRRATNGTAAPPCSTRSTPTATAC